MDIEGKTIGFIGLGVMGNSMAGHLLDAGKKLEVYTRSPAKAKDLLASGAVWRDSAAALAKECQVIFTMVGYPSDVEQIYFGQGGLIENAAPGAILVDATTSSPALAARIHREAKARGILALDAPVSGGDIGARNATLTIMVGGDEKTFLAVKPLFDIMGKTAILQGGPGAGQHTKMANQIAIAGTLLGAVEAMSYAKAAGLDQRSALLSIESGSAASWQLTKLAPRMLDSNFEPGFYVKHFLKDLRIALDSARAMKVRLPLLALAESLYAKASDEGMDEYGTHVLYLLYQRGLV